jgi:hypothetical protein
MREGLGNGSQTKERIKMYLLTVYEKDYNGENITNQVLFSDSNDAEMILKANEYKFCSKSILSSFWEKDDSHYADIKLIKVYHRGEGILDL